MSLSPDRSKILGQYFKSQVMSRNSVKNAVRRYQDTRRVFTPCAKKRGSRHFKIGDRIVHRATRGSRVQVYRGTAHHTCGMSKKSTFTQHPVTGRIVSKKRRLNGLKAYKSMSPETKAKFLANQGNMTGLLAWRAEQRRKKRGLRNTARVNYKGM